MKKFVLALVFALIASVAMAATHSIQACTTDHKAATLTVDIQDGSSDAIVQNVIQAFNKAAAKNTADTLLNGNGFKDFVEGLTEEAWDALTIENPPTISDAPQCK
jgi:ABC-type glycerol-3-phosphate transport system substrate-binding protein